MTKDSYFTLIIDSATNNNSKLRQGMCSVRNKVYVQEMDIDSSLISDDLDKEALHIACIRTTSSNFNTDAESPILEGIEVDDVVGTSRIIKSKHPGFLQVERVAVVKEARGQGLAGRMVAELEEEAHHRYKEIGAIHLTTQEMSQSLYKRLGYFTIPDSIHFNYDVWMIKMIKPINEYWKDQNSWNIIKNE